jgi:streptomycin 6-kinase
MDTAPFEHAAMERYPTISTWQADAPTLVATMLSRWHLEPRGAFIGGVAASVLEVNTRDGFPAILKVGYPHPEAIWEAVGLTAFPPGTAPEVLDQDAWTWSMLLEPIVPGTPLSKTTLDSREAMNSAGALLAKLSTGIVPNGLPTLADAMTAYATDAMLRLDSQSAALDSFGVRALVVDAVETLMVLAASASEHRLLHGDFNPGNILLGPDGRWLAVDPKPLVGDPAFDLWPLVSQVGSPFEAAHPASVLAEHLELAAAAAGVDRDRAASWAYARAGLNVSWYLADGLPAQAATEAAEFVAWATVAGR